MLIKTKSGVVCRPSPVGIGSKHLPKHAIYSVDGEYWERMPTFDYYEQRLQKALLSKIILPEVYLEYIIRNEILND